MFSRRARRDVIESAVVEKSRETIATLTVLVDKLTMYVTDLSEETERREEGYGDE